MPDYDTHVERYTKGMRERLKKYGANCGRKRFEEWKAERDGKKKVNTR